jgi:hypothetical protein
MATKLFSALLFRNVPSNKMKPRRYISVTTQQFYAIPFSDNDNEVRLTWNKFLLHGFLSKNRISQFSFLEKGRRQLTAPVYFEEATI